MEDYKIHLLALASVLFASFSLGIGSGALGFEGTMAAIGVAVSFLSFDLFKKEVLKRGRDSEVKLMENILGASIFLVAVSGGLLSPVVPESLVFSFLAVFALAEIFRLEASADFRKAYEFRLGMKAWFVLLAASYVFFDVNVYYLFYGFLVLLAVFAYNFVDLVYRILKQEA